MMNLPILLELILIILQEDAPAAAKVIPAAKKQADPVGLKKKEKSSDTSESDSDSDEDNVSLRTFVEYFPDILCHGLV